jgi:pyruvate dehydrogenase E2 component (dihydrolipoamide acetyltransferase)
MSIEITMPKLGFEMQEGILLSWLKNKGDHINVGEPIFEVETDKAAVEVEAFNSGILTHTFFEPGQVVKVGSVIGLLDGVEDDHSRSVETLVKSHEPSDVKPPDPSTASKAQQPRAIPSQKPTSAAVRITPLARRIAHEKGIDFLGIRGTGPEGLIVKQDILNIEEEQPTQPQIDARSLSQPGDQRVPLSRMRKVIAKRMMQSHVEVPQFTVSISIEMDKALDLRSRYNAIHPDQPLSINDLIIRGAALVLRKYPQLNSSYREQELEYHSHINIGIAVTMDEGLMTVVLREADHKTLAQISVESKNLIQRAKDNKNRAEDIEGSTFTISNLGMFGIDDFVAIINPPEAAILAVGAVQVQPKFMDGTWVPCSMAKFNLSIDHRVSDGAEAARYLKELKTHLEEPVYLI